MNMKTPTKRKPVVVSIGEVLWDLFESGPCFGGAAANFACHATALGARAFVVSAVGKDRHGREARRILNSLGVDTKLLQDSPDHPTGSVAVCLDGAGKPVFRINDGAAWDCVAWSGELAAKIAEADAVYFGTLAQREPGARSTIRRALAMARDAGVPGVLDINLRPPFFDNAMIRDSISLCRILKFSDDEFPTVAAACGIPVTDGVASAMRVLLERHDLDLVAMTRGADGALLVSRHETIDQPGIATDVCDTVGAGDSFTAAMTMGLLAGDPLVQIACKACETAAFVCSQPGAVPQLSAMRDN